MKNVKYENLIISLDEKNSLGAGGEATVIAHNNLAFKLYHDPTPDRIKKLTNFLKLPLKLSNNVASPINIVYDEKGNPIGFTMPIFKQCKEVSFVSNKKYRTTQQITSNEVIKLFLNIKETLDSIHSSTLVIGDFNDLNVLFSKQYKSVFIDVDSFQFGKFPCIVGTELFLDPVLYGVNLSKKPSFSKETDWYSFAVMLFKSLLLTHPYGGNHKTVNTLYDRAQKKLTVLEKDVIYPTIALNPDTISDELLDYFHKMFSLGQRNELPITYLKNLENNFLQCNLCNTYYFSGRGKCPNCFKTTKAPQVDPSQLIMTNQTDNRKCVSQVLFETDGSILFSKVLEDQTIAIIEYSRGETTFHLISDSLSYKILLWKKHQRDLKYDFFKSYLVVASDSDLTIFNISSTKIELLTSTTSMQYDGDVVFSCSASKLYRLSETYLVECDFYNDQLTQQMVKSTLENQTWFEVGQSGFGLGFFRVFEKFYYFVFSKKGSYEIKNLQHKGKLIETQVETSKNTLALFQKFLDNGRTYSQCSVIDDEGNILSTRIEETLNSNLLKSLEGKILVGSSIMHSTDAGIVLEKKQQLTLIKETMGFVDSNSKLALYKDGILAISDNKICFLRLT